MIMSVKIEHLSSQSEELWCVRFGTRRVQFRNGKSAQDYAAQLKARIEDIHVYPRLNLSANTRSRKALARLNLTCMPMELTGCSWPVVASRI
jgi:hypothetical protein